MGRLAVFRKGFCAFLFFVFLSCLLAPVASPAADIFLGSAAWKEDFLQLKAAMADQYANLEWAVDRRGLDLLKLAQETSVKIEAARSDAEAQVAIRGFLKEFGDGHLSISWPSTLTATATAGEAKAASACASYRAGERAPGVDFRSFRGFRTLTTPASRYFPAAVVDVADYGRVGILRIDLFSERRFPELCAQAATGLQLPLNQPCGDGCAGPLERETANLLTRQFEVQIEALKQHRIKALLVDISNNGGGSDWVRPAMRTLSPKRLLEPAQGYIRHSHWADQLSDRLAGIEQDLKRVASKDRPLMERAISRYRIALIEARKRCEMMGMWTGARPACSLISTAGPIYGAGILRYAPPGSKPPNIGCCYLFGGHRYQYREGVYSGPLLVLVDRETASAAEYFAAVLADNRAATIIGEPTYGAGCGYTNGGIKTRLRHSGGEVRMPDCVRFRSDGSNEVEGVTPDILVPWRGDDSDTQRSRRLEQLLADALRRRLR